MSANTFPFPEAIEALPHADIPFDGCTAYIVNGENEQVLFMKFEKDVALPVHSHRAQWGIVLAGTIEMEIDGVKMKYVKGDNYYIPAGVRHKGMIFAGYSDITYFDQKDRYTAKK